MCSRVPSIAPCATPSSPAASACVRSLHGGGAHGRGPAPAGIEELGAALEMLHTYSLIHDDLPALDNDDLRRGKPTCHVAFGEAIAILAGDALQTRAFDLARPRLRRPPSPCRFIGLSPTHVGTVDGMIGGQVMDIEGEHQKPTPDSSRPFTAPRPARSSRVSVVSGGVYAGANRRDVARLDHLRPQSRPGLSDRRRRARHDGRFRAARQDRRQRSPPPKKPPGRQSLASTKPARRRAADR